MSNSNKKWIAVVGSSRTNGNTSLITDCFISALREKNIDVMKYTLNSTYITTCSGCEYCINSGVCKYNDEFTQIINNMKNAEGYILASPSYNYNVTAQMKALLDRTFCLNNYSNNTWESRLATNKKAIVIGDCAGSTRESMGYTIEGMVKPLSELGINIIDVYEYYNTKKFPFAENVNAHSNILNRIKCSERL